MSEALLLKKESVERTNVVVEERAAFSYIQKSFKKDTPLPPVTQSKLPSNSVNEQQSAQRTPADSDDEDGNVNQGKAGALDDYDRFVVGQKDWQRFEEKARELRRLVEEECDPSAATELSKLRKPKVGRLGKSELPSLMLNNKSVLRHEQRASVPNSVTLQGIHSSKPSQGKLSSAPTTPTTQTVVVTTRTEFESILPKPSNIDAGSDPSIVNSSLPSVTRENAARRRRLQHMHHDQGPVQSVAATKWSEPIVEAKATVPPVSRSTKLPSLAPLPAQQYYAITKSIPLLPPAAAVSIASSSATGTPREDPAADRVVQKPEVDQPLVVNVEPMPKEEPVMSEDEIHKKIPRLARKSSVSNVAVWMKIERDNVVQDEEFIRCQMINQEAETMITLHREEKAAVLALKVEVLRSEELASREGIVLEENECWGSQLAAKDFPVLALDVSSPQRHHTARAVASVVVYDAISNVDAPPSERQLPRTASMLARKSSISKIDVWMKVQRENFTSDENFIRSQLINYEAEQKISILKHFRHDFAVVLQHLLVQQEATERTMLQMEEMTERTSTVGMQLLHMPKHSSSSAVLAPAVVAALPPTPHHSPQRSKPVSNPALSPDDEQRRILREESIRAAERLRREIRHIEDSERFMRNDKLDDEAEARREVMREALMEHTSLLRKERERAAEQRERALRKEYEILQLTERLRDEESIHRRECYLEVQSSQFHLQRYQAELKHLGGVIDLMRFEEEERAAFSDAAASEEKLSRRLSEERRIREEAERRVRQFAERKAREERERLYADKLRNDAKAQMEIVSQEASLRSKVEAVEHETLQTLVRILADVRETVARLRAEDETKRQQERLRLERMQAELRALENQKQVFDLGRMETLAREALLQEADLEYSHVIREQAKGKYAAADEERRRKIHTLVADEQSNRHLLLGEEQLTYDSVLNAARNGFMIASERAKQRESAEARRALEEAERMLKEALRAKQEAAERLREETIRIEREREERRLHELRMQFLTQQTVCINEELMQRQVLELAAQSAYDTLRTNETTTGSSLRATIEARIKREIEAERLRVQQQLEREAAERKKKEDDERERIERLRREAAEEQERQLKEQREREEQQRRFIELQVLAQRAEEENRRREEEERQAMLQKQLEIFKANATAMSSAEAAAREGVIQGQTTAWLRVLEIAKLHRRSCEDRQRLREMESPDDVMDSNIAVNTQQVFASQISSLHIDEAHERGAIQSNEMQLNSALIESHLKRIAALKMNEVEAQQNVIAKQNNEVAIMVQQTRDRRESEKRNAVYAALFSTVMAESEARALLCEAEEKSRSKVADHKAHERVIAVSIEAKRLAEERVNFEIERAERDRQEARRQEMMLYMARLHASLFKDETMHRQVVEMAEQADFDNMQSRALYTTALIEARDSAFRQQRQRANEEQARLLARIQVLLVQTEQDESHGRSLMMADEMTTRRHIGEYANSCEINAKTQEARRTAEEIRLHHVRRAAKSPPPVAETPMEKALREKEESLMKATSYAIQRSTTPFYSPPPSAPTYASAVLSNNFQPVVLTPTASNSVFPPPPPSASVLGSRPNTTDSYRNGVSFTPSEIRALCTVASSNAMELFIREEKFLRTQVQLAEVSIRKDIAREERYAKRKGKPMVELRASPQRQREIVEELSEQLKSIVSQESFVRQALNGEEHDMYLHYLAIARAKGIVDVEFDMDGIADRALTPLLRVPSADTNNNKRWFRASAEVILQEEFFAREQIIAEYNRGKLKEMQSPFEKDLAILTLVGDEVAARRSLESEEAIIHTKFWKRLKRHFKVIEMLDETSVDDRHTVLHEFQLRVRLMQYAELCTYISPKEQQRNHMMRVLEEKRQQEEELIRRQAAEMDMFSFSPIRGEANVSPYRSHSVASNHSAGGDFEFSPIRTIPRGDESRKNGLNNSTEEFFYARQLQSERSTSAPLPQLIPDFDDAEPVSFTPRRDQASQFIPYSYYGPPKYTPAQLREKLFDLEVEQGVQRKLKQSRYLNSIEEFHRWGQHLMQIFTLESIFSSRGREMYQRAVTMLQEESKRAKRALTQAEFASAKNLLMRDEETLRDQRTKAEAYARRLTVNCRDLFAERQAMLHKFSRNCFLVFDTMSSELSYAYHEEVVRRIGKIAVTLDAEQMQARQIIITEEVRAFQRITVEKIEHQKFVRGTALQLVTNRMRLHAADEAEARRGIELSYELLVLLSHRFIRLQFAVEKATQDFFKAKQSWSLDQFFKLQEEIISLNRLRQAQQGVVFQALVREEENKRTILTLSEDLYSRLLFRFVKYTTAVDSFTEKCLAAKIAFVEKFAGPGLPPPPSVSQARLPRLKSVLQRSQSMAVVLNTATSFSTANSNNSFANIPFASRAVSPPEDLLTVSSSKSFAVSPVKSFRGPQESDFQRFSLSESAAFGTNNRSFTISPAPGSNSREATPLLSRRSPSVVIFEPDVQVVLENINRLPQSLQEVASLISRNDPSINRLDCTNMTIATEHIRTLSLLLKSNTNVTLIDFSGTTLDVDAMPSIALMANRAGTVEMNNCNITDACISALVDKLMSTPDACAGVKSLGFDDNVKISASVTPLLARVARQPASILERISLQRCPAITPIQTKWLSFYLDLNKQHKQFKSVLLAIEAKQVITKLNFSIPRSKTSSANLKNVDGMFRREFDDRSVRLLCIALSNNDKVDTINFRGNRISDRGGKMLAQLLQKNRAVREVDLAYNEVGNETVYEFERLLDTNTVLVNVDLSENKAITDFTALQRLSAKLQRNLEAQQY